MKVLTDRYVDMDKYFLYIYKKKLNVSKVIKVVLNTANIFVVADFLYWRYSKVIEKK